MMIPESSAPEPPSWARTAERPTPCANRAIRACYRLIADACRRAGTSQADADDLAQDLWEWLLRRNALVGLLAAPWLRKVAHYYILRQRRSSRRHRVHEGRSIESAPEPIAWPPEATVDANQILDRLTARLPLCERSLLALIRLGFSLAEASRWLGIPHGSQAYHHRRLVTCARRALGLEDAAPGVPSPRRAEPAGPAGRDARRHDPDNAGASRGPARAAAQLPVVEVDVEPLAAAVGRRDPAARDP